MKKFFGYSGIGLALILLLAGSVLLFRLQQFQAGVAQLKDDGYPVSIADMNVEETEAQQETNRLVTEAIPAAIEFDTAMWKFTEEAGKAWDSPVDEATIAKFNELEAQHPDLFPLLKRISERDEIDFKMEGDLEESLETLLDRVQQFRNFARVLQWKAKILAAQGKPDEALETSLQILRLSQLADQHPMLISRLVGVAVKGIGIGNIFEIISNHEITDQSRQDLHEALESLAASTHYTKCLEGERAYGISNITEMGTDPNGSRWRRLPQNDQRRNRKLG